MPGSNTESPAEEKRVRVVGVSEIPEEVGMQINICCVEDRVLENSPPKVQIKITNDSNIVQEYACGLARVFTPGPSKNPGNKLILIPERYPVIESDTPLRPTGDNYAMDSIMKSVKTDPGESVSNNYLIWDYWENSGEPFALGEYLFETEYHVSSSQEEDHVFTWSFKLLVED